MLITYLVVGFIYSLYCLIGENYNTRLKDVSIGKVIKSLLIIFPLLILLWPLYIFVKSVAYDYDVR